MTMITTSRETLKRQYNTTLQLQDLMVEIRNTLNDMRKTSEITQKIIYNFRKQFDTIRKNSPKGFLAEEIFQLTSWLNNISDPSEALESYNKCMEDLDLDNLLSCFNPSNFKESVADATNSKS